MACIKSAARSALVAFAPDAPYLAAGTMAGAVDLSFSSTANLEIFELDFQSDAHDLSLVGASASTDRFNRLSWSKPLLPDCDLGLVAGGLGDGTIGVWNPRKMINSNDQTDHSVVKLEKHVGPVRGLEFNAIAPNLLASGADEGELCIWDLAKPSGPSLFPPLKSVGSGAQTELSFVSWNPKFQNIIASTSYNGITVVWDLKSQKQVTSFSDSTRRRCSVLQWNPENSTQIIIASDDDNSPSLRLWDVRKAIQPLREFVGHTQGVIAMSWCPYDSSYLLTCAKDNRTICWDTGSGQIVCELPASTSWNFDVHWYLKVPGVISASSFDVKVGIYNIEACSRYADVAGELSAPVRLRAPKWLRRPTGVSFGFGGKLVSFHLGQAAVTPSTSEVHVHQLVTEHSLVNRSTEFEAAIQNGEKSSLRALCEKKSQDSVTEDERETWGFLRVMFEEEGTARSKLLSHLGFNLPDEGKENVDSLDEKLANTIKLENTSLIEGGEVSGFPVDDGEEFFNNIPSADGSLANENNHVLSEKQIEREQEDVGPHDSSIDDNIQRALVVGDYKGAVLQCVAAKRMADALVIAHAGGPSLWESTRAQYLNSSISPYLKVVSAMVNNDLTSLVNMRPLNSWKETLALLCTGPKWGHLKDLHSAIKLCEPALTAVDGGPQYIKLGPMQEFGQEAEWTALCNALASRLMTVGNTLAATLCYICAGNIDNAVSIWSRSLKSEYGGRSYVDLLQDLMEKTIVFALAAGQKQFSPSLSKLVENYAELLASQGLLATAMEYLKLLGSEESSHELAILRDRIALSAEGKEAPRSLQFDSNMLQTESPYMVHQTSYGAVDGAQTYYQDKPLPQQHSVSGNAYPENYQQSPGSAYGGYPVQQKPQVPDFSSPALFQPTQPRQMFIPTQMSQIPQQNFAPPSVPQPAVRAFVPSNPVPLRNVEQYQQPPSLASHLYHAGSSAIHQPGPTVPPPHAVGMSQGQVSNVQRFAPVSATQQGRSFVPVTNPSFPQRPVAGLQPSSPTKPSQVQSLSTPAAPPPTIQTVDTSNVPAELKAVITTLTRLYNETAAALGGSAAHPSKKREIEDNSRKIGSLFAKLDTGDVSPNAATKLVQLCQALDAGDFSGALHIQVVLTTSDWDECNFWLAALKRMIKTRQSVRL